MINIDGIDFTVGKDTYSLSEVFGIDQTRVSDEFAHQAGTFAYFGQLLAKAEHRVAMLDMQKDQMYGEMDGSIRELYAVNGNKITEPQIKAMILSEQKYVKVQEEYAKADYEASLLKIIVKALEQKATMLIGLGATLRQEYEMTGMRINEKDYASTVREIMKKVKDGKHSKS